MNSMMFDVKGPRCGPLYTAQPGSALNVQVSWSLLRRYSDDALP